MTRLSTVTYVATLIVGAVLLFGCRVHHLGDNHGKAYHNAVEQQAQTEGTVEPTPMSADEAKSVMRVHITGEDKGGNKGASMTSGSVNVPTSSNSSGSLGGGKWPGSSGNINLEAK